MDIDLEKLASIVEQTLKITSPVLSGNMRSGIELESVSENEITISIKAPFYDLALWKKENTIKHTGKSYNGITNYAMWVNDLGAFGRGNKSMHWVNRALNDAVSVYGNEIGAVVINELEL